MKRWIHAKEDVVAMSLHRNKIIERMQSRSPLLAEHLSKCAMYCNCLPGGKYDHWIEDEIATWINDVNSLVCKHNNKKLKPRQYEDELFGDLGTSESDALVNLHDLQIYNSKKSHPYPYVEIDDAMANRLYIISQGLIHKFVPILSSMNTLDKHDIESILHNVIDPVCKGIQVDIIKE